METGHFFNECQTAWIVAGSKTQAKTPRYSSLFYQGLVGLELTNKQTAGKD